MSQSGMGGSQGQWEDYVQQAREKLPEPPPGIQDAYCKWIPWLAIIFGVIGVFFLFIVGVLWAVIAPLLALGGTSGIQTGLSGIFSLVLGIAQSILGVAGGWMMMKMRATGWWIYAIGLIVGAASNLATFSILGLIITLAIAWVHIFVRPRYA